MQILKIMNLLFIFSFVMVDRKGESMNNSASFKLTNDKFIKVFASRNPDILKMLISDILGLNYKECEFKELNTLLPPDSMQEYLKTLDFNVMINNNIIVNLEINSSVFSKVKHRNYVYLSKLVNSLLKSGNNPGILRKYQVYQININANDADNKKGYRLVQNLYHDDFSIYMKNIKIIEINLAYYKNLLYTEDVKLNKLEKIYASLKSESVKELDQILKTCISDELRTKIIKEVKEIMGDIEIVFTEEEARGLENFVIAGYMNDAEEEGIKKGLAKGLARGKREGKIEGKREGMAKGIEQGKIEVAKNLLSKKISVDVIKEVTGLSIKTIKSLML